MFNKALILSLSIFLIFMVFTSSIKHKTRTLEKKINVLQDKIISLKKDLKDAKTDYVYLSSPAQLEKYLIVLDIKDYITFDTSNIFFSPQEFIISKQKETKLLKNNEYEKTKNKTKQSKKFLF